MNAVKNLVLGSIRRIARLFGGEDAIEKRLASLWRLAHHSQAIESLENEKAELIETIGGIESEKESLSLEVEELKRSNKLLQNRNQLLVNRNEGKSVFQDLELSFASEDERREVSDELYVLIDDLVSRCEDTDSLIQTIKQLQPIVKEVWHARAGIGGEGFYQSLPFYVSAGPLRDTFFDLHERLHYGDPVRVLALMYLIEIANTLEEGDYGEFGVREGPTAKVIHCMMDAGRELYLFDTFEGFHVKDIEVEKQALSQTEFENVQHVLSVADGEQTTGYSDGVRAESTGRGLDLNSVVDTVADERDRGNIHCIKGWLPDSLVGCEDLRWRFVHLDLDLYAPTKSVLDYVWPRLVPGGIIAIHDCREINFIGGRKAVEEFADGLGLTPIAFPDVWGTAVLVKKKMAKGAD